MSKCECFAKMQEKLKSLAESRVPEGAVVEVAEWDNLGLFMKNDTMTAQYYANFKIRYRKRKKDGDMAASLTKADTPVVYSFCPFCGVKQ